MSESLHPAVAEKIVFGAFVFDRTARELLQNGKPVRLRKRELDILDILTERAGDLVSDTELMERIWPGQPVSEVNLRVQMAGLQRVLGDGGEGARPSRRPFIQFMQGAGYRFGGLDDGQAHPAVVKEVRRHNLPGRRKPLFGRDGFLKRLHTELSCSRLISVVAQGGTGKTSVCLAAAEALLSAHTDGVWLIDLAGISDAHLVTEALSLTFDMPAVAVSREAELIKWLAGKDILILLDNCEHVAGAVAELVTHILSQTRGVRFLTTSRIALGAEGETVLPLEPLDIPPSLPLTADIALTFPAVAFFVESLRANGRVFDLDVENLRLVIQLCRDLNGNPLAIELAAAQMCLMGAGSLTTQPEALTAIALEIAAMWKRQDTVLAMLEWSHDGLSPKARLLLARLSVCRREFTRATALAIATDDALSSDDVMDGLAELTRKSLITVGEFAEPIIYHMLVLVRDYAAEKLLALADHNEVTRRHALNCLEQLRYSGGDALDQSHAASIDDIRAAVEWSFSEDGDVLTGMRLISLAVDNNKKLYGIQDYARQLDRALTRYDQLQVIEPSLQLRILVERMCVNQHGSNDKQLMAKLKTRAFELAYGIYAETGDPADLFSIHQTAFSLSFSDGNGPEKKLYARQMEELAAQCQNSTVIEIMSARLTSQAHHFMGEHHIAVPIMRKIMAMSDSKIRKRIYVPGDRVDPRITSGIFNARSSWLLGSPEQATAEAMGLVEKVRANWDYVLCYVIGFSALPIAIWRGDITGARTHLDELQARAAEFNLAYWAHWGECYARVLAFFESGRLTLADPSQAVSSNNMQIDLLATFHEGLLTREAVERVETGFVGWCAPEVLRTDADRSLNSGALTAAEAEAQMARALTLAERQQALAWQLRIATSLGRLWRYQGKSAQARELLQVTTGKFTEGFGDADFVNAMAVLKDL